MTLRECARKAGWREGAFEAMKAAEASLSLSRIREVAPQLMKQELSPRNLLGLRRGRPTSEVALKRFPFVSQRLSELLQPQQHYVERFCVTKPAIVLDWIGQAAVPHERNGRGNVRPDPREHQRTRRHPTHRRPI